ncbi:MAG: hypothetical protein AAF975_06185 [Spirochaetota bacterium]
MIDGPNFPRYDVFSSIEIVSSEVKMMKEKLNFLGIVFCILSAVVLVGACGEPASVEPKGQIGPYDEIYDGKYRAFMKTPNLEGTIELIIKKNKISATVVGTVKNLNYGGISSVKLPKADYVVDDIVRNNGNIEFGVWAYPHPKGQVIRSLKYEFAGKFRKNKERRWGITENDGDFTMALELKSPSGGEATLAPPGVFSVNVRLEQVID